MAEIGTRLRRLREERGLSRAQLAKLSGVSASEIEKLERGERGRYGPTIQILLRLAAGLESELQELLGLSPTEHSPSEIATIRELLARYLPARGYAHDYERLGRDCKLGRRRGEFIAQLTDAAGEWPGLTAVTALNLYVVLRFGDVAPGDEALKSSDREAWLSATHSAALSQQLTALEQDIELDRRARRRLARISGWARSAAYFQRWSWARWRELRFAYIAAESMLRQTVRQAEEADANPELLGIMLQDLTEAYIALGDLKLAEEWRVQSEAAYNKPLIDAFGDRRPAGETVQLGLGRAKVQELQIAVWEGASIEECEQLYDASLGYIRPISDDYGWCKASILMAYLHLVNGDIDQSTSKVDEAWEHAKEIEPHPHHPYWILRDGWYFGSQWMTLHVLALRADLRAVNAPQHRQPLPANGLDAIEGAFKHRWWARKLPPIYPFYSWRYELGEKSVDELRWELTHRVAQMRNLGLIQYVPLAMVANGDYELERDSTAARRWYREARDLAGKHSLGRLEQLANQRLDSTSR